MAINKVILLGNVGSDPEIYTTKLGRDIVYFSLATDEQWKDAKHEKQTRTQWHQVVVMSKGLSLIAKRMITKGTKVYIEGTLRTKKRENGMEAVRVVVDDPRGVMQILHKND